MGETVFPGVKAKGAFRCGAYASLVNGNIITIGSKVFEFRTTGSASAGHIQVDVGASGALTIAALLAALVANPDTPLIDGYVDPVDTLVLRLEAHNHGTAGNVAFSATLTGATNIIDQTSGFLVNGEQAKSPHIASGRYTIPQLDVTAGCIMIPTTVTSPKIISLQIFSTLGAPKNTVTTKWTVVANRLKGALDGGTDPVAGDVVAWSARD